MPTRSFWLVAGLLLASQHQFRDTTNSGTPTNSGTQFRDTILINVTTDHSLSLLRGPLRA